jgi:hypothetical protein
VRDGILDTKELAPEKLIGSVQTERQIPIVNPTEDEAASKQREPMATQPQLWFDLGNRGVLVFFAVERFEVVTQR